MRDQANRRRSGKAGNKQRRKNPNRVDGNGARHNADGNTAARAASGPGVCEKCGHPAPDGKLCNFHRSLLNSIRNDFGKRTGRSAYP